MSRMEATNTRIAIQKSIGRLDGPLREALLLTTRHSFGKCARIIGVSREVLADRVYEARRHVVDETLGTGHHDSEVIRMVGMYIDGVATRMQRRRESMWYRIDFRTWGGGLRGLLSAGRRGRCGALEPG